MAETKLQMGDFVIVTTEHQGLPVGTILNVTSSNQGALVDGGLSQWAVGTVLNFTLGYVERLTRTRRAECLEKSVAKLRKEADEKEAVAKRLRQFGSDEEELADLLISVQDSKGSRAERVRQLAGLLQGRIKTNHL